VNGCVVMVVVVDVMDVRRRRLVRLGLVARVMMNCDIILPVCCSCFFACGGGDDGRLFCFLLLFLICNSSDES